MLSIIIINFYVILVLLSSSQKLKIYVCRLSVKKFFLAGRFREQ